MRLRRHRCTVALLGVLFFLSRPYGQTTTSGALTGVVVDPTGAVLRDASIKLTDREKGTTDSTKTDGLGAYQFSFLRPGKYELEVVHPGFQHERRSVAIQVGPSVTVNITLQVASSRSEISVTGEAPVIQADNADVSVTISQKQVSEVPNPGNDLTYIAQTAPGAIMNTDGGGGGMPKFSILGMPGFSYAFTVDGVSITENTLNVVRGGPLGLTLGTNQIQEATVVTSAYSGQFGNAAGGNINYVSKSGSNTVHGNAEYFWNGTVLNANDWFNQAAGNPRPFSIANQWAGSFGGPIRSKKLFFFLDTEGLRLIIPQVLNTQIPTPEFRDTTLAHIQSKFGVGSASDLFYQNIFSLYDRTPRAALARPGGLLGESDLGCGSNFDVLGPGVYCARTIINTRSRPSQDTLTSGRIDWNVGESDRAFFRLQQEGGVAAQYDDPIDSVFDGEYDNSRWQAQALETHTFSSSAASQFLIGFSDHYWDYKSSHPTQALAAFPTFLNFSVPGNFTNLGGDNALGWYGFDIHTLQISEDVSKIRGAHKLDFGLSFNHEHWGYYSQWDLAGEIKPETLRAFYEGGYDPTSAGDFTILTKAFSSKPRVSVNFGGLQAYVQDEWHARKNLALTFALRAEHNENFSCENECFSRLVAPFEELSHDPSQPYNQVLITNQKHAIQSLDLINWSPRFGFAWQALGVSHASVLRGGAGILYDPFQDALAEEIWLNPPNYNSYNASGGNLVPGERNSLFQIAQASNTAFVNGYTAGQSLSQLRTEIPDFVPPWVESLDRRMHRPQYQRWSVEWEQALDPRTTFDIGYFGHHGIHELVRNPNANAYGFGSLPAAQCSSPPVPPCADPRFGEVEQWASRAISNYHGMVVSFRHQFTGWGGGLVHFNYTYGHALDEISNNGIWGFTQGGSSSPQDVSNLREAYGPAEYDVRHSLNANYVWELPLKSALRGHGPNVLLKGWQVSGTIFARTGFPYTVFDMALSGNLQENNYFGQIYAVPAGPLPKNSECGRSAAFSLNRHPCLPPQYIQNGGVVMPNPNALFIQSTCETDFNKGRLPSATDPCGGPVVSFSQGRNRFRAPSYFNTDVAVMKITKLPGWENGTLAIGFQFFNVLNHPSFGTPDNWSSDPTFGLIFFGEQGPTGILGSGNNGSARMIQLKSELKF